MDIGSKFPNIEPQNNPHLLSIWNHYKIVKFGVKKFLFGIMRRKYISIVVAMYNIKDYIKECLESIILQKGVEDNDYEVIIINDGSTDDSLEVAYSVIRDKTNYIILSQINSGLSEARNAGMRIASGEYVWFIDGDDLIPSNALYKIINEIKKNKKDIYVINYSAGVSLDSISETSSFVSMANNITGREIHESQFLTLPIMAYTSIYRNKFLFDNNLFFMKGIIHEDLEFTVRAHHLASSIQVIEDSLYFYRICRTGSIMETVRLDNTRSLVSFVKIIDSFRLFFKNENTVFTRYLFGKCATLFFARWYDNLVMNPLKLKIYKENKWKLYGDLLKSRQLKRMAILILLFSPSRLIVYIFKKNRLTLS